MAPAPPAARRDRAWLFTLVVAACAAAVGLGLFVEDRRSRAIVAREDRAAEVLRLVAAAETALRERTGRYGWLGELAEEGLLPLPVEGGGADEHLSVAGHRVEVLLPTGRLGGAAVAIAPRGGGAVDEELRRERFAVVARPVLPGGTGWRSWYLDEDGVLYLAEGVADVEAALRSPLPLTQVKSAQPQHSARELLWQRADALFADP